MPVRVGPSSRRPSRRLVRRCARFGPPPLWMRGSEVDPEPGHRAGLGRSRRSRRVRGWGETNGSNGNPNAVSPAGAQGIAQFMPATAAAYGLRDPFDPVAAIAAQARLMGELLAQFGGSVELALAAYNAGPGAVRRHGGIPPYAETRNYVQKVTSLLGRSR